MHESEGAGQRVGTRRDGRVLVITMERTAKRNAIDRAMADASMAPSTSWTTMTSCGPAS